MDTVECLVKVWGRVKERREGIRNGCYERGDGAGDGFDKSFY